MPYPAVRRPAVALVEIVHPVEQPGRCRHGKRNAAERREQEALRRAGELTRGAPNGIPIHRAALPSTTAKASTAVTASPARRRRSSWSCVSTTHRLARLRPSGYAPRRGWGYREALPGCLSRLGRLVLAPDPRAAGDGRALHVELVEADHQPARTASRSSVESRAARPGGVTAWRSSGPRGGGGRRTSAASSSAIWRWSCPRRRSAGGASP